MAVAGLVSSIMQFVSFSREVIERLNEFRNAVDQVPKAFQDISTHLPLIVDNLNQTRKKAEARGIDVETQKCVIRVVEGCQDQVQVGYIFYSYYTSICDFVLPVSSLIEGSLLLRFRFIECPLKIGKTEQWTFFSLSSMRSVVLSSITTVKTKAYLTFNRN